MKNFLLVTSIAGLYLLFCFHMYMHIVSDKSMIVWMTHVDTSLNEHADLHLQGANVALVHAEKMKEFDQILDLAYQVDMRAATNFIEQGIFNENVAKFIRDQRQINDMMIHWYLFDEHTNSMSNVKTNKLVL